MAEPFPCGTHAAYDRGCRCHDCTDANTAYHRQRRARNAARGFTRHGTNGTYASGCRCELCRDARAEYMRAYRGHTPTTPRRQSNPRHAGRITPRAGYAKGTTLEELLEAW